MRPSIWGNRQKDRALQPERHREQRLEPGRRQREGRFQHGERQRARDQPLRHALQEAGQPDHALRRTHEPHDLHLVTPEVEHERGRRGHREDGRQGEHRADAQPHELKEALELGQPLDPLGTSLHVLHLGKRRQSPDELAGAFGGGPVGIGGHLDGGGQRVPRKLVRHVSLPAERALEQLQCLVLGHVAHPLDPAQRLDPAQEIVDLDRRRLLAQVDDDAHPVAPLVDRAAEIQRQEPEATERRERQRDEQDGADADPPRPPEVAERLAQEKARHAQPSSFTRGRARAGASGARAASPASPDASRRAPSCRACRCP